MVKTDRRYPAPNFVPKLGPLWDALASAGEQLALAQAAIAGQGASISAIQDSLLTLAGVQSTLADAIASVAATSPQFISAVARPIAELPAASSNVGKYARVTDLFGDLVDNVIAVSSGSVSYWRPVRTEYAKTVTMAADMTVTALGAPPSLRILGTLAAGRNRITLSKTGAYPGAEKEFSFEGSFNLQSLTIAGLAAGSVLALLTNTRPRFRFDGDEWRQFG